jgi:hypothetical protein
VLTFAAEIIREVGIPETKKVRTEKNVMAGVGGEAEKAAADVNGDGAVNVGDIMAVINIMASK